MRLERAVPGGGERLGLQCIKGGICLIKVRSPQEHSGNSSLVTVGGAGSWGGSSGSFLKRGVQIKGLNRVKIKTEKMAPLQCSKEKLCGGCSL